MTGRRILFAGGGTGGHIMPGLAVAAQAKQAQAEWIGWVGDPDRLEATLVPRHKIPLFGIGLSRPRLRSPRWWLRSLQRSLACLRLLWLQRPDAVVAMGGYPALLPALLAPAVGIPVVLLESNALPGKTNRLLGQFARLAVVHFPDAARFFPRCRVVASGNPLSSAIMPRARGQRNAVTLLVMGGSLAARTINAAALALAPWLAEVGWRVIHLAGQEEAAQAREVYQQAGVQAEVMGFCHDMPRVYAEADIVLGRAGASSCAELALAGLGSVLVPLPIAAEDHQTVNAQALAQRGAAVVVPQDSDDGSLSERLQKNFSYLAADPKRIHTMGAAALGLARPQAAAAAWQLIDTLIGRPGGKP